MPKYLDKAGLEELFDDIKDLVHGPSYSQVSNWMDAHPDVLSSAIATDITDATDNWLEEHPEVTTTVLDESISFDKLTDAVHKGYVRSFETVADMQAATNLKAGMTCHTNGFHTSGDGGAAYYTVSANGTANSMDVLTLQGGLYATLMVTGPCITPEQFGAYGDGVHDDSTSINYCIDHSKSVKFSREKSYLLGNGINITGTKRIDFNNAQLVYDGSDAAITLAINNSVIENLILTGNYTGYGLAGYAWFSHFENIKIEYFAYGINFDFSSLSGTAVNNTFVNIFVRDCTTYGILYGALSNAKLTDAHWTNVFISCDSSDEHTPMDAFMIGAASGHKLADVHIYGPWANALRLSDANRTEITNLEIEQYTETGIIMQRARGHINVSNVSMQCISSSSVQSIYFEKSSSVASATLYATNVRLINVNTAALNVYVGGNCVANLYNTNLFDVATVSGSGNIYIDGLNSNGVNQEGNALVPYKRVRLNNSESVSVTFEHPAYTIHEYRITVFGGTGSSWWNPFGSPTVILLSVYNDNGTIRYNLTTQETGGFTVTITPTLADGIITLSISGTYAYAYAAIEML